MSWPRHRTALKRNISGEFVFSLPSILRISSAVQNLILTDHFYTIRRLASLNDWKPSPDAHDRRDAAKAAVMHLKSRVKLQSDAIAKLPNINSDSKRVKVESFEAQALFDAFSGHANNDQTESIQTASAATIRPHQRPIEQRSVHIVPAVGAKTFEGQALLDAFSGQAESTQIAPNLPVVAAEQVEVLKPKGALGRAEPVVQAHRVLAEAKPVVEARQVKLTEATKQPPGPSEERAKVAGWKRDMDHELEVEEQRRARARKERAREEEKELKLKEARKTEA